MVYTSDCLVNTSHAAKVWMMRIAFLMIRKYECNRKYRVTQYIYIYIYDNRKLMLMLKKHILIISDVIQDADDMLGEIQNIKYSLKIEFEFTYFPGDVQKPSIYERYPIDYLIETCDEE